jgi:ribosomal protein RSM22 (predicted rRNA methylase)
MRPPSELLSALEFEISQVEAARLAQASAQLSRQYQAGDVSSAAIKTDAQRAAYLAVRLPATYAAAWHVFSEVHRLAPQVEVASILDLGAGPGTAAYAAAEVFTNLNHATLLESDGAWLAMGQRIAQRCSTPVLQNARWIRGDISREFTSAPHDLVVIAYALGELHQNEAESLLKRAWNLTSKFLVVVEPGTMRGFGVINAARSFLIASGDRLLAPCPHQGPCPMAASGDWCHFAQRLERTALHRRLKGGALGHEDEKFSYIVASKVEAPAAAARIVRHPQKHGGHVQLALCAPDGLKSTTVSRSQKQAYKLARNARWGQAWDPGVGD